MVKIIMVLVFGIASIGSGLGVTAEKNKPVVALHPCVVLTGADSHVSKVGYHRITSMKDWAELWQKHKGQRRGEKYDLYYNPLGLPLVDFKRYMVIGIFQGSGWNSAGLKAVSVSQEKDRIVFRFDDKSYQTQGPDGGGEKVRVYGFFVLPRSSKPVTLEENVQGLKGKPPVWKERVTFPKL